MIIIKNIPSHIKIRELKNVINPLLKGRFWQKSGTLKSLKMIEVSDARGTFLEYHCIGIVTPKAVRDRIIKKLNGKEVWGIPLVVHKYTVRNWRNNSRQTNENPKKILKERRIMDRRRSGITVKEVIHDKPIFQYQDIDALKPALSGHSKKMTHQADVSRQLAP